MVRRNGRGRRERRRHRHRNQQPADPAARHAVRSPVRRVSLRLALDDASRTRPQARLAARPRVVGRGPRELGRNCFDALRELNGRHHAHREFTMDLRDRVEARPHAVPVPGGGGHTRRPQATGRRGVHRPAVAAKGRPQPADPRTRGCPWGVDRVDPGNRLGARSVQRLVVRAAFRLATNGRAAHQAEHSQSTAARHGGNAAEPWGRSSQAGSLVAIAGRRHGRPSCASSMSVRAGRVASRRPLQASRAAPRHRPPTATVCGRRRSNGGTQTPGHASASSPGLGTEPARSRSPIHLR